MSTNDTDTVPISNDEATPDFWVGWLAQGIASAISQLRKVDSEQRQQLYSKADVAHELERTLDTFLEHPVNQRDVLQQLAGFIVWGWALLDANGELYALRTRWDEIERARADAESYLDGAATCGHPRAASWVAERLPFVTRQVTRAERAELIEEWGTPVLDREP